MDFATPIGSRTVLTRGARALLLTLWALATPADVRAEPFRFPWDPPPAPPPTRRLPPPERILPPADRIPLGPDRLSTRQVREILAREGAQLIGKPRAIRDELIAIGRDSQGLGRKFILDAISGEVLAVVEVGLPDPPRRRDVERFDLAPPGSPPEGLPPPVHASPDPGESAPVAAPSAPPANVAASPAPPPPPRVDPADAALSPIKPLRPPGAPKVEPLPQ
jgi:hypothetical protein